MRSTVSEIFSKPARLIASIIRADVGPTGCRHRVDLTRLAWPPVRVGRLTPAAAATQKGLADPYPAHSQVGEPAGNGRDNPAGSYQEPAMKPIRSATCSSATTGPARPRHQQGQNRPRIAPHRSAPARKRTPAVAAAAGAAAAARWAGTAQSAATATLTAGPNGLQSAGLASAPGPCAAATDATSLQSGLFLPGDSFTPSTCACRRA